MRAHTQEKPFVCPVKSCRLKFAIKSNCMAHGRTRHNRSFKPIVFDIIKGEAIEDTVIAEEPDDDDDEEVQIKNLKLEKIKRPQKLTTEQRQQRQVKTLKDKKKLMGKYFEWVEYCRKGIFYLKKELALVHQNVCDLGHASSFEQEKKNFELDLDRNHEQIAKTLRLIDQALSIKM